MPAFIYEYYLTVCEAIVNRRRRSKNGSLDASQAISSLVVCSMYPVCTIDYTYIN
jgi:hypothetical protein